MHDVGQATYSYSAELELALAELGGVKKWRGWAGAFTKPARVGKALREACKVLRKRLKNIVTADDRLLLTTGLVLDSIERVSKELGKRQGAEVRMIAYLLHLSANLLGYDWLRGVPNREVVYFQTLGQQMVDDRSRHPDGRHITALMDRERDRLACVLALKAKGLRIAQIADVMSVSETRVKDMLVRADSIQRDWQSKET